MGERRGRGRCPAQGRVPAALWVLGSGSSGLAVSRSGSRDSGNERLPPVPCVCLAAVPRLPPLTAVTDWQLKAIGECVVPGQKGF